MKEWVGTATVNVSSISGPWIPEWYRELTRQRMINRTTIPVQAVLVRKGTSFSPCQKRCNTIDSCLLQDQEWSEILESTLSLSGNPSIIAKPHRYPRTQNRVFRRLCGPGVPELCSGAQILGAPPLHDFWQPYLYRGASTLGEIKVARYTFWRPKIGYMAVLGRKTSIGWQLYKLYI